MSTRPLARRAISSPSACATQPATAIIGRSPRAARYAGFSERRALFTAFLGSGALAGLMGTNVLMGDQHRMFIDYTAGAGFIGIAVSLMGRSHPVGIVLASILFGALIQGGQELVFSDFDYVEVMLEIEPHPDAIRLGTDPFVIIRPEGRWHEPGILERSSFRPVTRPSVGFAS